MTIDADRDLALHPYEGDGGVCGACGEHRTWHPAAPVSVLVAFCPDCRSGIEPYEPGVSCYGECGRKYVKRRFYPCRECGGYYSTAEELAQHVHGDWEEGVL